MLQSKQTKITENEKDKLLTEDSFEMVHLKFGTGQVKGYWDRKFIWAKLKLNCKEYISIRFGG